MTRAATPCAMRSTDVSAKVPRRSRRMLSSCRRRGCDAGAPPRRSSRCSASRPSVSESSVEERPNQKPVSRTTGATDGYRLRLAGIPTFGVSGLFSVPGETNSHGRDEKLRVKSFYDGLAFLDQLVRRVAGAPRM